MLSATSSVPRAWRILLRFYLPLLTPPRLLITAFALSTEYDEFAVQSSKEGE